MAFSASAEDVSVPKLHATSSATNKLGEKAAEFSRKAGLKELSANADELRIWGYDYMTGEMHGLAVTPDRINRYGMKSHLHNGMRILDRRRMVLQSSSRKQYDIRAQQIKLQALNDRLIVCPVMDGGSVLVEGALDGRVFRVEADNPWACGDEASQLVSETLRLYGSE
jgi:hypothetical protein